LGSRRGAPASVALRRQGRRASCRRGGRTRPQEVGPASRGLSGGGGSRMLASGSATAGYLARKSAAGGRPGERLGGEQGWPAMESAAARSCGSAVAGANRL
jgi:hypothetical protein